MKKLMSFALNTCKDFPEQSFFTGEGNALDWREDFRRYAAKNGWKLEKSDLESVASMLDFMIANSSSFCNCIRRSDVKLPGDAVLLDSTACGDPAPIMLFWEEEL